MIVTDAQAHIWVPETPDRQWTEDGRSFAHGPSFGAEELVAEMAKAKVDRVVLVPPSYEGDRNDVCLAAAAEYPDRFRVMGRLTLTDPANRGTLATWLDQPGMVGIRVSFSRGASRQWLHDGTADWVWPEAEGAGIPVMIFCPGQLDKVVDIAQRHPGLPLVIDHLGINTNQRDGEMDPVIDELVGLARFDNVAVKASCLPSNVTEPYPFPSLHDRIHRVVDAFSPRRTFWGSDISRLPCTYDEVRRLFVEELDFLTGEDLEWVMGRGISAWLKWPVS